MSENINKKNPEKGRSIFIISDGTGITAESIVDSILAQFDYHFEKKRFYFTDTPEKVNLAVQSINDASVSDDLRPIVFHTLAQVEFSNLIKQSNALHFDLMHGIVAAMEEELGQKATQSIGTRHKDPSDQGYLHRMEAINFTLMHDDGQSHRNLESADVILIGVSRSGKTPTSLYLSMHFGIKVANYPLIPEDFERNKFPAILLKHREKLFGLSIDPVLLSKIRHERRPNSTYASLDNCRHEVHSAEELMQKNGVRWLSSTAMSIEEIASSIYHQIPFLQ